MSVSVIAYSHRYEKGGLAVVRLYVAGENAVSVIEDGRVETGLEGRGARCLALDPKDPDTLYVGTSDEGIFKSEDGGGTWEKLSGIGHPRVTAVAVSPTDGAVYAGTEPSALFVSRDGGLSWRELEGMSYEEMAEAIGVPVPGVGDAMTVGRSRSKTKPNQSVRSAFWSPCSCRVMAASIRAGFSMRSRSPSTVAAQ
jgi:hypothetical protein